ncbi:efflux RND transporter periplasmic adaptor subunit [Ciceribacter sp. L1K23]|uniref:efflux RND transporter periplasmic adaptor subunit n=1 Tax=Ciceribacter sp. L1K23 TaxID=2820276 RepID=UPI001B82D980|nr:efflux RND transporter periplasmic adaptor subunit [Ciceribacter sp. L1K23]MBR0557036.1 efflux RND transporter periplasmic adaptor subunit [Ciceribacter sp. L1K23]
MIGKRSGRLAALVVLALASGAGAQERLPLVAVEKPKAMDVVQYLQSTGTLAAEQSVDLVARASGLLEKVNFRDGEKVKKGDVIFGIEREPYEISLASAQADVRQQEASLAQAAANLTRQRDLKDKSVVSASALEDAIAQHAIAESQLAAARARLRTAELNLGYTEITAPFDGILSARLADVGAYINGAAAQKLATLVKPDPLHVNFTATDRQVVEIRRRMLERGMQVGNFGLPVSVELSLTDGDGYPFNGPLDYVAPEIDPTTGTMALRGEIANPDLLLSPGMFVKVRVAVAMRPDALTVPERAIGNTQEGRTVLVVGEENRIEQRLVEIGAPAEAGRREIRSGLEPDDRVVIRGGAAVAPGQVVSVEAMPQEVAP